MLNPELQVACEMFAELHPGFGTPEGADGVCGYATDLFLEFLAEVLPEQAPPPEMEAEVHFTTGRRARREQSLDYGMPIFAYHDAPHPYYRGGLSKHLGHIVVNLGNICIDWTARQFRPDAPFPLVFRMPVQKQKAAA